MELQIQDQSILIRRAVFLDCRYRVGQIRVGKRSLIRTPVRNSAHRKLPYLDTCEFNLSTNFSALKSMSWISQTWQKRLHDLRI